MSVPALRWLGLVGPIALAWLGGCTSDAGHVPSNPQGNAGMGVAGMGNAGTSNAGASTGGSGPGPQGCETVTPGKAQIRRLTRFEYSNVIRDLFGDTTNPGQLLPTETISQHGNLFGNDAALLSVSSAHAEKWGSVAAEVAARATATPEALGKLAACASTAAPDDACARQVITSVASRAYHRDLQPTEVEAFLTMSKAAQGTGSWASGMAAVIEAVLQGPEFLYRVEHGVPAPNQPGLRKPTPDELAARLSFLFWGTIPDEPLRMAAKSGQLDTPEGVKAQAERLLGDPRAKSMVRFFFDNLLPISGLTNLRRDAKRFPIYSRDFAAALREETQQLLEHTIFDADSPGTWTAALTAPHTYVNEQLAGFYGIPGVTGPEFRKATWPDPTKRLGLLTQAGVMTGTIVTNESNPVLRGTFMINKIMCMNIHLPTDPAVLAMVKVPENVNGTTARERFTQHSKQALCAGCHAVIDPVGFTFENYDPIGQWRDTENGVMIDASGSVPGVEGAVNGPVELIKKLVTSEMVSECFAQHWLEFGYGKTHDDGDACIQADLNAAFKASGGNVKQLLVGLTQTDSFLYLPAKD
ncbi:MAG TPA: DUF1592 domain-containing protein [Polyangiaceae bacterium]